MKMTLDELVEAQRKAQLVLVAAREAVIVTESQIQADNVKYTEEYSTAREAFDSEWDGRLKLLASQSKIAFTSVDNKLADAVNIYNHLCKELDSRMAHLKSLAPAGTVWKLDKS
jgi:hypothetical protein